MFKKYSQQIQTFGRSLLLPIGVLAPVGMLMGICGAFVQPYMIAKLPFLGNEVIQTTLTSIRTMMSIIFDNIPLLFAMGVAYGVSKKDKGIAVFASVVAYLVLIISMNIWLNLTGNMADADVISQNGQIIVLGVQTMNLNTAGGIIAGLVAAWATDRFYNLQLPIALAFFGGKKSVPIITMVIMAVIGLTVPFIWEIFVQLLQKLSVVILSPIGPLFTAGGERLLIPFGLHHIWNAMFRFTEAGGTYLINGVTYVGVVPAMQEILFNLGPSSEYWAQMPSLTRFMAQQQMLVTMFVFPAICIAMYKTAKPENKKEIKPFLITLWMTAFLGNVTEPLEFTFVFIAPLLFVIYAIVVGIAATILPLFNVAIGYIRGTIFDFTIFGLLYDNTNWIALVLVGVVTAVIIYFIFKWYIVKFDVKTPGREDDQNLDNNLIKEKKFAEIATLVVKGLGGKENIANVENCITRLRIDIVDTSKIDNDILKQSGSTGIFFPSKNHIHVVFGPLVEFVRTAVDDELRK